MVRFGAGSLLLTCVLAQLLALPVLGIALQEDAQLAAFHNHALTPWPDAELLRSDPTAYVRDGRAWLTERIYPVQFVTRTQKTVLLRWFNEPPEPRVSLGEDGHIFLNGGSNQTLFGLFTAACVSAHSEIVARSLGNALNYWTASTGSRGVRTDFIVIPTAATLYADKLERSTPANLRKACLERMQGQSPLFSARARGTGPVFLYALHEMLAKKHDPAFYPKANWHPVGMSLQVVRDAYLARLGAGGVPQESLQLAQGPAEILLSYGIELNRPFYALNNPFVAHAPQRDSAVRSAIAQLFRGDRFVTHAYQNSRPIIDENVLMLSDSFGDASASVFAGAFRTLIQVNLNDLQAGRPSDVLDHVRKTLPLDRVIFVIQEGNAPQLAAWR